MSFFLGIDLGTTNFKAGIFNEDGDLLGLASRYVKKDTHDGLCELPVDIFWDTIHVCVQYALQEANVSPEKITALSYSSQTNSFILLDKHDQPLTSLILWPDERVKEPSISLQTLVDHPDFLYKTGLGIKPGKNSSLAKIDWFQKTHPNRWAKVQSIMSISDYLVFFLTGKRMSDTSTSSMIGLFDVSTGEWWQQALDIFGIEKETLSIPLKIGSSVGKLSQRGSQRIGLTQDTILFLGGLDHHIVAIGAGLPHNNYISESNGTVLACVSYKNEYKPQNETNTAQGLDNDHYFQMAFDNNGASVLDWYQKSYTPDLTIDELILQAEQVEIGSNGLIANPQANKYRGLYGFNHISEIHKNGHFVRSILESNGKSLLRLVILLDKHNTSEAVIPSGGGAKSKLWLQIKANLLNKVFLLSESIELACKGAAMVCAVGMRYFDNINDAIDKQVAYGEKIYPIATDVIKYKNWYNMHKH